MTDLHLMARLLSDIVDIYEQVLDLLGEQTRALVSHNLAALETLHVSISTHLSRAADLEAERYSAQQRLAQALGEPDSVMTLGRVATAAGESDPLLAGSIRETGEALRIVLQRIGDAQHLNGTMVNRQLRLQRRVFATLQKGSPYNPDGSLPAPKTEIIDRKI